MSTQENKIVEPTGAEKSFKISDFIKIPNLMNQIGFIFYIAFLLFVSVIISNYSESNIRKIDKLNSELKELHTEYITSKSEFMFRSKQSEIASKLAEKGLKESVTPPKKIVIE